MVPVVQSVKNTGLPRLGSRVRVRRTSKEEENEKQEVFGFRFSSFAADANLHHSTKRTYLCIALGQSGRSAVGSAPGLGPGGRRFESCHPDILPLANAMCPADAYRFFHVRFFYIRPYMHSAAQRLSSQPPLSLKHAFDSATAFSIAFHQIFFGIGTAYLRRQ